MQKQDWLLKLRRVSEITTLEKIIQRQEDTLSQEDLIVFYSASDHRLAEIIAGKYFDKVPSHMWRYVR